MRASQRLCAACAMTVTGARNFPFSKRTEAPSRFVQNGWKDLGTDRRGTVCGLMHSRQRQVALGQQVQGRPTGEPAHSVQREYLVRENPRAGRRRGTHAKDMVEANGSMVLGRRVESVRVRNRVDGRDKHEQADPTGQEPELQENLRSSEASTPAPFNKKVTGI